MDYSVTLDVSKSAESKTLELACLRRGEKGNAVIAVEITAKGEAYDLAGREVWLQAELPSGKVAPKQADAVAGNVATVTLPANFTAEVGLVTAYLEIREGDDFLDTTQAFSVRVLDSIDITAEEAEEAKSQFSSIAEQAAALVEQLEESVDEVNAAVEAAAGVNEVVAAAEAATASANAAAADVDESKTEAGEAAASAIEAAESANAAAASVDESKAEAVAAAEAASTAASDATLAAASANTAASNANEAYNTAQAVVAQLPVPAGNFPCGSASGDYIHVGDAYPAPLGSASRDGVAFSFEGASYQATTTGKNLAERVEGIYPNASSLCVSAGGGHICYVAEVEPNTYYTITSSAAGNKSIVFMTDEYPDDGVPYSYYRAIAAPYTVNSGPSRYLCYYAHTAESSGVEPGWMMVEEGVLSTSPTSNSVAIAVAGETPALTATVTATAVAAAGDTALFTCELADDSGTAYVPVSYRWQRKTDSDADWIDSALSTARVLRTTAAQEGIDANLMYRCVVTTDWGEEVTSNEIGFTVDSSPSAIAYIDNMLGVYHVFEGTCEVLGLAEGVTASSYQWQYSKNGGSTFYNGTTASAKTREYRGQITQDMKDTGRHYRCVVTLSDGSTLTTNHVKLDLAHPEPYELRSATEPCAIGDIALFTCTVEGIDGESVSYGWEYSTTAGSTWAPSSMTGADTSTLQVPVTQERVDAGIMFRCVVTISDDGAYGEYEEYSGGYESPSPDWPQPVETLTSAVVNVQGRNLLDDTALEVGSFAYGSSTIANGANYESTTRLRTSVPIPVRAGESYTLSRGSSQGKARVFFYGRTGDSNTFVGVSDWMASFPCLLAAPDGAMYCKAIMGNDDDSAVTVDEYGNMLTFQLELGTTAHVYEPYSAPTETECIPSSNYIMPALPDGTANELRVKSDGSVQWVDRVRKAVFDGTETWASSNTEGVYYAPWPGDAITADAYLDPSEYMCDTYIAENVPNASMSDHRCKVYGVSAGTRFYVKDESYATVDEFKAALAESPITVYRKRAGGEAVVDTGLTIGLPSLPGQVSNVWIEGNLPVELKDFRYMKDIDVVLAGIMSALGTAVADLV